MRHPEQKARQTWFGSDDLFLSPAQTDPFGRLIDRSPPLGNGAKDPYAPTDTDSTRSHPSSVGLRPSWGQDARGPAGDPKGSEASQVETKTASHPFLLPDRQQVLKEKLDERYSHGGDMQTQDQPTQTPAQPFVWEPLAAKTTGRKATMDRVFGARTGFNYSKPRREAWRANPQMALRMPSPFRTSAPVVDLTLAEAHAARLAEASRRDGRRQQPGNASRMIIDEDLDEEEEDALGYAQNKVEELDAKLSKRHRHATAGQPDPEISALGAVRSSHVVDQRAKVSDAANRTKTVRAKVMATNRHIEVPETCSIDILAQALDLTLEGMKEHMKKLNVTGPLVERRNLNSDEIELLALDLGFTPVLDQSAFDIYPDPPHPQPTLQPVRPPIVCVMGHVDHGKTTLLDTLRSASVAQSEAGGITQHIGAFEVPLKALFKGAGRGKEAIASVGNQTITFLDTPGHAAFSAMRARGAGVTDVVVLVVAADDGVMPQTREVIDLVVGTDAALVVAITKCDKAAADSKRVEADLASAGVEVESIGGDIPCVHVSALAKTGLDELLETIVTIAEIRDLRAERAGVRCEGRIIESSMAPGRGNVATVVVTRGTLEANKFIVAGEAYARARQLIVPGGATIKRALPGQPVEIAGWKSLPDAGDQVLEAKSEDEAVRAIRTRERRAERIKDLAAVADINARAEQAAAWQDRLREQFVASTPAAAGDALAGISGKARTEYLAMQREAIKQLNSAEGALPEVRLVVKADFNGTLEAVVDALECLKNDRAGTKIVLAGVGDITDSDLETAVASNALIIGYNVAISRSAQTRIKKGLAVETLCDRVIYAITENVKERVLAAMPPLFRPTVCGEATVIKRFSVPIAKSKRSTGSQGVAGSKVSSGSVHSPADVSVLRQGEEIWSGRVESLRYKSEERSSIDAGSECGITLDGFDDFEADDVLRFTIQTEIPRTL